MSESKNSHFLPPEENTYIGIYDFSYAPYALGDVITWQMNVLVNMKKMGLNRIVQYIVADAKQPPNVFQPHINETNHVEYLTNLFPAFLCTAQTESVHVVRNKALFDKFVMSALLLRRQTFPSPVSHFTKKFFHNSHRNINKFFHENGYIPWLSTPKTYESSVDKFINSLPRCSFLVTVNIRQRRRYPNIASEDISETTFVRDSPMSEWFRFFRIAREKYPMAVFLLLGDYHTWDRELYRLPNVVIPRTMGMGLAQEITLMFNSDLFMGTSSGFSAIATFSKIPYIITNFQPSASAYIHISVGTQKYPWASDSQILIWQIETVDLLLNSFDQVYQKLAKNN